MRRSVNARIQNIESRIQTMKTIKSRVAPAAHAGVKTRSKRASRLAAKERGERKGLEIPAAECGQEAGGSGKRWVGRRVNLGKGGQEIGKQTGFSHLETGSTRLFPLVSTQVVDFPHLRAVRLFWEGMKWVATDKTRIKHGIGKGRPDKEVTEQVWVEKREIYHAFSRFIMLYHQDEARNYAIFTLSRVRPIFDKEARK